jgi:hypothetical protein
VLLGLLTGFGLAACGQQTTASVTAEGRVLSEPEAEAVEEHADRLLAELSGDGSERDAAGFLQFRQANAPVVSCMRAAGYDFRPAFAPVWTGYRPDGTSAGWLGRLGQRPSEQALATADSAQAERAIAHARPGAGYETALDRCIASTEGETIVDLGHQPGVPEDSGELVSEFKEMVFEVDSKLPPIGLYTSCMQREGLDYTVHADGEEGWQGLYLHLTALLPSAPVGGQAPSPAWRRYLELEHEALALDARCRDEQRRTGLSLLGPMLDNFEREHADDLRRSDQAWEDTLAEARRAGFE